MRDDAKLLFAFPLGPWHRTFAWLPHNTFDGGVVWLRFIWRRQCQPYDYLPGPMDWFFQYRRFAP